MAPPEPRHDDEPPATLGPGGFAALLLFLLFLGFPLADLLGDTPGAAHLVLVLAGVAAFVAIYLRLMHAPREPRDVAVSLAALTVLAAAIALDDTGQWATLFIYVSAACGFRLDSPVAERAIVAATAATAAVSFGAGYPADDAITYTLYAVAIGAMLRGFAHVVAVNRELHAARGEIARLAVGEERLRFARDLHDLLGHSLSVVALKSELARRLVRADPERAEREVGDIERVSREALVEVRDAVSGYRRMTLDAELGGAQVALEAAGIEPEVARPSVAVAPDVEAVLAWAVREGTTNVIRHSGARHCAIRVHAGLAAAGVEIVDDGGADGDAAEGSGLAGLRERAARRQGRVEAGRRPEGGFRLAVEVPTLP
jgi:two-component system, NarL family, sensor histidine kinase DesK